MLNSRLTIILRELMTAKKPITGAYLANLNQVTTRTTREDVKRLDTLLSDNGAYIESVMGKGYKLEIIDDRKLRKFLQTVFREKVANKDVIPKSPEERTSYLIRRLLLSEHYLKLDDLSEEIYVSRSTVQNDLKNVKRILNDYGIQLETRPNYGIKLKGSELKVRFCMSEYIFNRNDEEMGDHIAGTELSTLSKKELDSIWKIIMIQLKENRITLSDIAINNLLIHIAIACKRIKSGHHISLFRADLQEIKKQKEYQVAKNIVMEVEEKLEVDFPQAEIAYITIHLLGTKMLTQTNVGNKVVEQVLDDDINQLVMLALDKIEEEMNLEIRHDQELIIGLGLHLKPAINRYTFGMNFRNPMLADIKKKYPLAFEAGVIAGLAIEAKTGIEINENEIGYLTLHIGAAIERRKLKSGPKQCLIVCASGLGTAQLLYYRLKSKFPQHLNVIGTTEYYKLHEYNLHDVDLIVSSIPISEKLPVPVIEVNAILGDKDLSNIEKFIIDDKERVYTYFKKDLMFLRKNFTSKEETLKFLSNKVSEKGLVEDSLLDAIYEREEVAPTSFGNLVAVPHPITPKSQETFLAICTLEKPILWKDKPVQFVCLLCVKKESTEDLQSMYELLGEVINNRSRVQHLIKADTYEDFMNVLDPLIS
ncbi:MAG TPA: BglG family transcription antiterminator [Virgibacillus sp.]|nr:BglG family transcription antiterminator [Virgibacillus sp.]HLR68328.1 BglG family transcription antiterminator [Virgibacillus sp.]